MNRRYVSFLHSISPLRVVINNFDAGNVTVCPCETYPPLVVDPDTVLALSVAFKQFQAVTWCRLQKLKRRSSINSSKLPVGCLLNIMGQLSGKLAIKYLLSFFAPETFYHKYMLTNSVSIGKPNYRSLVVVGK